MSAPPVIDGFDHLEAIGAGGFAEVHLYEQRSPRRPVAVKVLSAQLDDEARRAFVAESQVLARLSSHPSILTVYASGIAADGRPYLVMENCSRGSYEQRLAQQGPLPLAEALSVGVQLAGALETAHRAGVVHRDVKPANILETDYGLPALADFGIASAVGVGMLAGARSLSLPWAPPEHLAEPPWSGPASDVYELAATVATLLLGRSPHERAGEQLDAQQLADRIRSGQEPPLDAALPAELRDVLQIALAANPHERYSSALAFGRALQEVEGALGLSRSRLDIGDTVGAAQTRTEAIIRRTAEQDAVPPTTGTAALGATVLRAPATAPAEAAASAPRRSRVPGIVLDAALVAIVLALGAAWLLGLP